MAVENSRGEVEAQEWISSLVGRRVLKFCVGAGLELHVDGSDFPVLTIECPLRLGVDGDAVEPTSLDVLAFLKTNLLREVLRAEQSHGTLRLGFDDGADLSVEPHPLHEAWQMCNDAGLLIVCMPGGEFSVWSPG